MNKASDSAAMLFRAVKQDEIDFCRGNICYFVENYCKIENIDSSSVIIPFKLWEKQRQALLSISQNKLNIILKARQLGLSWLVLAYCAHRMLCFPGSSVVALSRTETEAHELARRLGVIFSNMNELVRREKSCGLIDSANLRITASGCEIIHPNGAVSSFKVFPSAANAVRSFTANLLILDEWAFQQQAREIWTSAFPAVNRLNGGQVIGISTMVKGTLFEQIFTGENDFNKIFLPWNADPSRTADWYESTKKQLGDMVCREYPSSVSEALSLPSGGFFPELRDYIHLRDPQPVTAGYRRYVSLDYGLDMLSAGWYYVDFQGFERGYREVNRSGLIVSDAAKLLLEMTADEKIYQWFAPPDLWNRNRDTGKSTADIFRDCGIRLTKVSNDREQGWLDLKEHLRPIKRLNEHTGEEYTTARLTFDKGAMPQMWNSLKSIQVDKTNPCDAAKEPHILTHAPDALRYFAAGRPKCEALPQNRLSLDSFPSKKYADKNNMPFSIFDW